ncbi:MAG: ClbS/DfsB family four-helix bundle protein [Caldithrix sp.]|nr:ClbS/DfsB family four-helix bundle protein [Caldithrix sp.]
MAKPKTKNELINASQENYSELITLVDSFTEEEIKTEFPKETLNRNIRDVLTHLHHWHLMFLNWYKVGMKNEKPDMPAKGYSWKETPQLNKQIWENYQSVEFGEARKMLEESFSEIQQIIKKHTNKELFEKKRYKWTGSTSLGAYIIANTSSHYKWAYTLIKKAKR